MAGSMEDSEVSSPRQPPPFLEVVCTRSGKIRRFSVGTEAGFAVSLINKKLLDGNCGGDGDCLLVSYIEAVKEGEEEEEEEEPVNFGPNTLLVDYGPGWKLQTVTESHGDKGGALIGTTRVRGAPANFLEVVCTRSGKIRHFPAGTEAGFAVSLINKKLLDRNCGGNGDCLLASFIEAVKEGDEDKPVNFGPNTMLVDYGPSWKLRTVTESHGDKGGVQIGTARVRRASANGDSGSHSLRRPISLVYIGKILLAFLLIFALGAAFTLVLENLPQLILHINSSA